MTTKIKPKLPTTFEYQGTFFDDLAVTVFESTSDTVRDEFSAMLDEVYPVSSKAQRMPPMVMKTYWLPDRRYNPFHHNWTLDDLIDKLTLASSFGPVEAKILEQHSSFTIERQRPEDKVVKVSSRGVCLNEWSFQPIYRLQEYESLAPAIYALREIQTYLRDGGEN